MGLRFRKSIKLGPGVRLNLGRKSGSISFGGPLGRYTVSTTGRRTTSVNLPGGLSYTSSSSSARRSTSRSTQSGPRFASPPALPSGPSSLPKPGFFAPAAEKRYYEGVQAYLAGDMARAFESFRQASAKDARNVSDDFFAGLTAIALGLPAQAIPFLERAVQSDIELPDELQRKYLPPDRTELRLSVSITERVSAAINFDSLGAALTLAELYQGAGRREDAIGLLQQLDAEIGDEPALKLSLCDLLFEDQDYEGVIEVAAAVENDSDIGLACLHLKAMALAVLGLRDAALEAFAGCLRRTAGRSVDLLREIRYDRATFLEAIGDQKRARKDWELLYTEAPKFRDVARRVMAQ